MICDQCPRKCHAERDKKPGFCGFDDRAWVSHVSTHAWEEPCISGERGAGTVFFSGCNLRCVFCQNAAISRGTQGKAATVDDLCALFERVEQSGAECLDLVNPTHFTSVIREALTRRKPSLPVVWNSGGYECAETVRTLDGLVDVYMPDLKYVTPEVSQRYSGAADYFTYASEAITEMFRQTGRAVFDERGMMKRGTLVRHLVLPAHVGETVKVLTWLHEHLPDVTVSLMGQYFPAADAHLYPEIDRRLKRAEYKRALDALERLGFDSGFYQELGAADERFVPHFDGSY